MDHIARVTFNNYSILQNNINSDNDVLIARIDFRLDIIDSKGVIKRTYDSNCIANQPYGEHHSEPISFDINTEVRAFVPYLEFCEAAEECYRRCIGVGSESKGVLSLGENTKVTITNANFHIHYVANLQANSFTGGW